MKIVVYGLGIIGGSICASLKRVGHTVYAKNRSREPIEYALTHTMIDGEAKDYDGADVVVLALPPRVTMRELDEGNFPKDALVLDICGVKEPLERVVFSRPRAYRYIGTHPMAGKETSGIGSASAT
ncbi:MAG: prephenate dehydrogenase/arogenate dehydrogenase family protein, partial [Clostridia bacterium]|nr:prephenate dehydrogenase/arogenate dehydrogenase family protein [Clostridia bacterium]